MSKYKEKIYTKFISNIALTYMPYCLITIIIYFNKNFYYYSLQYFFKLFKIVFSCFKFF